MLKKVLNHTVVANDQEVSLYDLQSFYILGCVFRNREGGICTL